MLRLNQNIHGTRKIVVLDSSFYSIQVFVGMKNKGVYGATIIKNRRYWPRYIDGKNIKSHITNKYTEAMDALRGDIENFPIRVFAMKEEDYLMMIMCTYGGNEQLGE